jgi:hypothetical protein
LPPARTPPPPEPADVTAATPEPPVIIAIAPIATGAVKASMSVCDSVGEPDIIAPMKLGTYQQTNP